MTPHPNPTDLAAATERLLKPTRDDDGEDARYYLESPDGLTADAEMLARFVKTLLPLIRAVRDRKAEWDAWVRPGEPYCAGWWQWVEGEEKSGEEYEMAALTLAASLCGQWEKVGG